jgi:Glycosyl transferase family 2
MNMPKVSFVVPCYKLAHLLPECIDSILSQSFADFEILVMDDQSPDNTPEVARSYTDPRVRHIRNETNLGHLRNYNRGIELSQGKYVWLISADDRLRRNHALEKYAALMDAHDEVGYCFCPGYALLDQKETRLLEYSHHGDSDAIFDGREFLCGLLKDNTVLAASGMVRKALYDRYGAFPLDLPYAGDWYLWCLFALYSDVGYLAEPLVNYREHQMSITTSIKQDEESAWKSDGIVTVWRIKQAADNSEHQWLAQHCIDSLVTQYGSSLGGFGMTVEKLEQSLRDFNATPQVAKQIRCRSLPAGGDYAFDHGRRDVAGKLYGLALKNNPTNPEVLLKYLLIKLGKAGDGIRSGLSSIRS